MPNLIMSVHTYKYPCHIHAYKCSYHILHIYRHPRHLRVYKYPPRYLLSYKYPLQDYFSSRV